MPNQPSDLKSFLEALNGRRFVVVDTETTGLGPNDEICEFAMFSSEGETLFNEMIRPTKPISPDATRVTGISDRMVANKFDWNFHRKKIIELITGKVVVTYNATFDRKMMHQSDRAHNHEEVNYAEIAPWYCAMTAFAERYGNWNDYRGNYQWVKLIDAVNFYGIQPSGSFHGALADAQMTLSVIRAMQDEQLTIRSHPQYDSTMEHWGQMPGFPAPVHKGEINLNQE